MKIIVSFATQFDGQIADAAWLVESPANRRWISEHWSQLDVNSATFRDESEVSDVIDNVFEHHPSWTEILVRDAELTADIESSLHDRVHLTRTMDGFIIGRL